VNDSDEWKPIWIAGLDDDDPGLWFVFRFSDKSSVGPVSDRSAAFQTARELNRTAPTEPT
jgi:hypothetical protein